MSPKRYPLRYGFTLIEMGIVIAIIGILAGAAMFFIDTEAPAASFVDNTQSAVETVVRQGVSISGEGPRSATVVNGVQTYGTSRFLNNNDLVSGWFCTPAAFTCTVSFTGGRVARFLINTDASVTLDDIQGFSNYTIGADGRIART